MADMIGPDMIGTEEFAKHFGITAKTARQMFKRYASVLNPVRLGGKLVIDKKDFDKFKNQQRILKA